ncbi:MAG: AMP-binding protein [Acidimicrobiales bacterium]|nr:AMP-binding protein [Acidimicrobiales bacterium]MBO0893376.1 AMP-binding protein [Acidimicrobiales bacterium]
MNENFATVWEAIADAIGDRTAVVQGERRLSWSELESRSARLAAGLAELGVSHGSLVGIDLWNSTESLETMFAAFKLRAVPFNINYRYREAELVHLLADSKAGTIVFDASLAERVRGAAKQVDHPVALVAVGELEKEGGEVEGAARYEELIASHEGAERVPRSGEDELIVYTGGTTGQPKGVVWAHETLMRPGRRGGDGLVEHVRSVRESGERPTALVVPPLMHIAGLLAAFGTLSGGGCVVLCTSRSLNPDEILTLIGQHRVRSFTMIGDAYARPILSALERAEAEGRPYDLSSLETIGNTGVIWSAPLKRAMLRYGSFVIRDGLGATEGGGFAAVESRTEDEVGTARFRLGPSARVIGQDGKDVVPGSGEVGHLAATGMLPKGYLNDPERTARTWPTIDGVRYSMPGDMATVEADGTVVLLGRGSEVVNTGGEKVFVEEVEQAILTHPSVQDVLVVGTPDERWGQRVTAVVSVKPGRSLSDAEVADHVGAQLADYKRPRKVVVVDEVPRRPSGKADRAAAKELAMEAIAAGVRPD